MHTPLCPRCGHEFQNWQPVHIRCLLARLRWILSGLGAVVLGGLVWMVGPILLANRANQPSAMVKSKASDTQEHHVANSGVSRSKYPSAVSNIHLKESNLRQGPGRDYPIVQKLPNGARLKVIGQNGNWRKITLENGTTGWISKELIAESDALTGIPDIPAPPLAESSAIAPVVSQPVPGFLRNPHGNINLREGPGKDYKRLAELPSDTQVTVLAENGHWWRIKTQAGVTGWVSRELVERRAP